MDDSLTQPQQKLNEEFFRKQNAELLARLKDDMSRKERREELAKAAGIQNQELLDALLNAKITPESLPALKLVPLILVAWSDNEIQDKEREVILNSAAANGVQPNSTAHGLLADWLRTKPPASLAAAWKDYVSGLCASLSPAGVRMLREELMDSAEAVATASGGFLGLGSMSSSETKVLKELSAAFPASE